VTAARVMLADRPGVFRSGVSSLLAEEEGYEVLEADDAAELLAAARTGGLDLVLIDGAIASDGELRAVLSHLRRTPARVIVWAFGADPATAHAAIEAGADGYLHKEIGRAGLLRAIDAALAGETVLPRDLVRPLVERLRAAEELHWAREQVLALSPREQEVLAMVASGARNRSIAAALDISEFTVKRHVQNILGKLGLPSRRVAAALHDAALRGGEMLPLGEGRVVAGLPGAAERDGGRLGVHS
jgi:two-component system, NarL family, nitrate/nitrite response regulator NarL